jgi:type IV pilus assembly protein PilO
MAAADLVERFSKLPTQQKILAFVLIGAFIGAVFYFMFYSDLTDEEGKLETRIQQLEAEKASYEQKKRQYLAFRGEVSKLLETQKELLKVLPTKAEIHSLLRSVHAQGELSGLNILSFEPQAEVKEQYYARIPVNLRISGTFHQIYKFFYSVGQLKRIVNIKNLSMEVTPGSVKNLCTASFTASTFRFLAQTPQPPPKG